MRRQNGESDQTSRLGEAVHGNREGTGQAGGAAAQWEPGICRAGLLVASCSFTSKLCDDELRREMRKNVGGDRNIHPAVCGGLHISEREVCRGQP